MSKDLQSPCLDIEFSFFPTAWEDGVARKVFTLLVGADKLYPARSWGNEGKQPLPGNASEAIDFLTERYEAQSTRNRIPLFTDQEVSRYSFELFRSEWGEEVALGSSTFWAKRLGLRLPVDEIELSSLDVLVEVAAITDAPLVSLDYKPSWLAEGIANDARNELKRIVQGTVHAKAAYGPWRGLAPIPWRVILGIDVVKTIGVDRLTALPNDQAIDHGNGLWTLQTSTQPADSLTVEGRAVERSIRETLGPEFFVDIDADRLSKIVPRFSPHLVPDDTRLFDRYGAVLKPL